MCGGTIVSRMSIPACAGEPVIMYKVYPRVCGGTDIMLTITTKYGGLSPRVRGNPLLGLRVRGNPDYSCCADAAKPFHGSIPACAGEPDYESACETVSVNGLSPRVRGNRCNLGKVSVTWRSIPACAGEPDLQARLLPIVRQYGLSPRVRGNRYAIPHCRLPIRSIPACAGEPSFVHELC